MKQIMSTFVIVTGMCLLMILSINMISFQLQITNARDIHSVCVDNLQAGIYSDTVSNACRTAVADCGEGWKLDIEEIDTPLDYRKLHKITLHYRALMPNFGVRFNGVITGYGK